MEIDESFSRRKCGKLAHGKNLAPKIFLEHKCPLDFQYIIMRYMT
jgi:hypothetical protein